jgi:Flp pilus assembly protein TadG
MPVTALFNRVRTAARRFPGADQGNIAVIFAFAALPIVSFVGAAIDYSRANSARSSMQAALDSTALMLAKGPDRRYHHHGGHQHEGAELLRDPLQQHRR